MNDHDGPNINKIRNRSHEILNVNIDPPKEIHKA
jgi:hypothetical protein